MASPIFLSKACKELEYGKVLFWGPTFIDHVFKARRIIPSNERVSHVLHLHAVAGITPIANQDSQNHTPLLLIMISYNIRCV